MNSGNLKHKDAESWTWPHRPTDEASFAAMIENLDAHLHKAGFAPRYRPMRAASLVARKICDIDYVIDGYDWRRAAATAEPFSDLDLRKRVDVWYTDNYGAELLLNLSPGQAVLELSGNVWRIELPRVYGNLEYFLDRNLDNAGFQGDLRTRGSHNILKSVKGLTAAFAARLSHQDLAKIAGRFLLAQMAMATLEWLSGSQKFENAREDYRHSVDAIMTSEYGKARWEMAQTLEKTIKGMLDTAGQTYPKGADGHHLEKLEKLAFEKLSIRLPQGAAKRVDCVPGVRYGEIPSDRATTLSAHRHLLLALRAIGEQLGVRAGFPKAGAKRP